MDCADVERALVAGQEPDGPGLVEHVAGCTTCRFLMDDRGGVARALAGSIPSVAGPDLAELEGEVLGRLDEDRGPVAALRTLPRGLRALVAAAGLCAGVLFFYTFVRRPDWDAYPTGRMALTLGVCAGLAGVLFFATLRPLHRPPLSLRAARLLLGAGLATPILLALLPEVPAAIQMPGLSFLRAGVLCFLIGGGASALLLLLARALDRGGHQGGRTALLAAVGAGLLGAMIGQIDCPVNHPVHLLTGHASIPVGLALGYLAARRT